MTDPTHPTPATARLLLTTEQAADMLNLGRTTVYRLLRDGALRAVHIGRSTRLPHAELVRYVEALRAQDTALPDEPRSVPTPLARRATRPAPPHQAELFGVQDPARPQAG